MDIDDPDPRIARVAHVFAAARRQHRRVPLTRLVHSAWLALDGPSCARDAEDLADARAFFDFLRGHDVAGDLDDPAALEELMKELYAPPAPDADPRVQVLTMHKAKGLEFDTVILPGLQRIGRKDDPALLRWLDRPRPSDESDLLMAALAATGADTDPIYKYVGELARQQRAAEQLRQLYVATTRPKQRLHLIGHATLGKEGVKRPPSGSLLRAMWEVVSERFEAAAANATAPDGAADAKAVAPGREFRRLPAERSQPALPAAIGPRPVEDRAAVGTYAPFDEASQADRIVGIVVHRLLQRIAEDGLGSYAEPLLEWDPEAPDVALAAPVIDAHTHAKRATRIAGLWPAAEALLEREGLALEERSMALARVKDAVQRTLADPYGRWILSPHAEAASERALTRVADQRTQVIRLDRIFATPGARWIVDYKTSDPSADADGRHAAQLARYAAALAAAPGAPVRTALYFPGHGRFET